MTARVVTERLEKERPTAVSAGTLRVYVSPRLVRYGDVRDVTLGPSPGLGESGAPGVLRV
jgi:hypothetical protein